MNEEIKYSLKTKQFTKRKHTIFNKNCKDSDKQLSSLEIHEPQYQLNLFTGDEISLNNNSIESFQKKQKQKQQKPKSSYIENRHFNHQTTTNQEIENTLRNISVILLKNQQKLNTLNNFASKFHQSLTAQYDKHAQYLTGILHQRCQNFTDLLRKVIYTISKKEQNINNINQRVTLFENTLRANKEVFRIIKIKQDCLEAQIGNKNESITKYNEQNIYRKNTRDQVSQSKSSKTDENSEESKSIKMMDMNYGVQHHILSENSKFSRSDYQSDIYDDKFSPFEANSMLQKLVSTVPTNNAKDFKPIQQQYSFHNKNYKDKFPDFYLDDSYPQKYQDFKEYENQSAQDLNKLHDLIQKQQKETLWIDEMRCLRRDNGSYVLNEDGDPIINDQLLKQILRKPQNKNSKHTQSKV